MNNAFFEIPIPINEPVKEYKPGSSEKKELKKELSNLKNNEVDIPMYIGNREVRTENKIRISPPHDHSHTLGYYNQGDKSHVEMAINAAMNAKEKWNDIGPVKRANIFLKAAELIAGPY